MAGPGSSLRRGDRRRGWGDELLVPELRWQMAARQRPELHLFSSAHPAGAVASDRPPAGGSRFCPLSPPPNFRRCPRLGLPGSLAQSYDRSRRCPAELASGVASFSPAVPCCRIAFPFLPYLAARDSIWIELNWFRLRVTQFVTNKRGCFFSFFIFWVNSELGWYGEQTIAGVERSDFVTAVCR